MLALASEGLINRFFQWRYDTALVFVRISPDVAAHCLAIAVPLGAARDRRRLVGAAAARRAEARPPMTALAFAWRSLVRQPARSTLGILGVAAVGALLFDMLLLSKGWSSRCGICSSAWASTSASSPPISLPAGSPDIRNASTLAAKIAALPSVQSALTIRTEDADFQTTAASANDGSIVGVGDGAPPPWTVLRGRDPQRRRTSSCSISMPRGR